MAKNKKKKRNKQPKHAPTSSAPVETRAAESLTVFWSVSVLMVMVTNLIAVGAHFYANANPDAERMLLLKGLMLFTGSLVGATSLIVLPILYRIRVVPPPRGLAVFGACVAAAPILAALSQLFR